MIFDEIFLFAERCDLSENLNKFSFEDELENQDQMRNFIEEEYDENKKISEEISFLILTMEESTTDSVNIHFSEVNENVDKEKKELFMIINRRSLGIPLKSSSSKENYSNHINLCLPNELHKALSSNIPIYRPIPRKKSAK